MSACAAGSISGKRGRAAMSSAVIDRESGLAPAKSRPRLAGKRLAILGAALCVGARWP